MGSSNNHDKLTAAYIDQTAVICVEGRGSFKISPPMKQFIHQVIEKETAERIWIDMADCTGMDSTFMGVVAGIACTIKSKPAFDFKLINLSEKNRKLLTTLGVDRVVKFTMADQGDTQSTINASTEGLQKLEPDFANKLQSAKTTLEAHETLVDINPENYNKFKSVLDYLQDDVRSLSEE